MNVFVINGDIKFWEVKGCDKVVKVDGDFLIMLEEFIDLSGVIKDGVM